LERIPVVLLSERIVFDSGGQLRRIVFLCKLVKEFSRGIRAKRRMLVALVAKQVTADDVAESTVLAVEL